MHMLTSLSPYTFVGQLISLSLYLSIYLSPLASAVLNMQEREVYVKYICINLMRADVRVEVRKILILKIGNYPCRRMNYKQANIMKMWKGNGNTNTLLSSLKVIEILHQGRRGLVNVIIMAHFNSILFHKSGPANKQHTYQLTRSRYLNITLQQCRFRGHTYWLELVSRDAALFPSPGVEGSLPVYGNLANPTS